MMPEDRTELDQRIADSTALRYMVETPGYQFLLAWLQDNLTTYDEALKSKDFVDDHNGYLNARALHASYKNVIDFIEGTIEDGDRAKRDADELDRSDGQQPTD